MTNQPLLLTETQVPLGAVVFLCALNSDQPAADVGGPFPPMKCLIGGVPARKKFYPAGSILIRDGVLMASGMDSFKPEARFTPTEVFSPNDAPANTRFAVFVDGRWIEYKDLPDMTAYNELVRVYKDPDGQFISIGRYAHKNWLRNISLPIQAQLIPVTGLGEAKHPYR